MLISEVAKMSPTERFLYWIVERHAIHTRRLAGRPKPWTDDSVLQRYFFTNPYREHDKVTVWFRENVRGPMRDDPAVLFATVCFRWFNLPATGRLLMGADDLTGRSANLLKEWDEPEAVRRLTHAWQDGDNPVFTGAYMIKAGNGPRGSKIPAVCAAITQAWRRREYLVQMCREEGTLEGTWRELRHLPHIGGFMAYEVVTDLRHTALLENAPDINSWCNMGPGAKRGMNRLLGRPAEAHIKDKDWRSRCLELLAVCHEMLPASMPKFEMRDVEHSLCETDKMERGIDLLVRGVDSGRLKRRYNGTAD
jgi:hypothetical protein